MSIKMSGTEALDCLEGLKILAKNYRLGGPDYNDDWARVINTIAAIKAKMAEQPF